MEEVGYEVKRGKQIAFRGKSQQRFIRLHSLGEGYTEEEIQNGAVIYIPDLCFQCTLRREMLREHLHGVDSRIDHTNGIVLDHESNLLLREIENSRADRSARKLRTTYFLLNPFASPLQLYVSVSAPAPV